MFKMHSDKDDPSPGPSKGEPSSSTAPALPKVQLDGHDNNAHGLFDWIKNFLPPAQKHDDLLREAIEEYIEEPKTDDEDPISQQERQLFSNILQLRNIKVYDVMIPRAEIAAIDVATPKEALFKMLHERPYSRFPVYEGTLDTVLGSVHIKDITATMARNKKINLKTMLTSIPIVSPSMPILDLLIVMRKTRRHMVLVVDEYGGIDGMVAMGDVLETIVGEIEDEHEIDDEKILITQQDGSVIADAGVDIEEFEEKFGEVLSDEEREESDTLGGLVFTMAGRIPARGEILTHDSGMIFEVLEAGPRKVNKIKIRNIPQATNAL